MNTLHVDRLYSAAVTLTGNRRAAEELVRDVYSKLLDSPTPARREAALSHLFSTIRHRPVDDAREHGEPLALVAALGEDQREALVAVDVMGLSHDEAATALGVPLGTVMSRLYRARHRIAQLVAAAPVAC